MNVDLSQYSTGGFDRGAGSLKEGVVQSKTESKKQKAEIYRVKSEFSAFPSL